jgi:large subunit ribosomal protein L4
MQIDVINKDGKKISTVELKDALGNDSVNKGLIYEAVRMQLANRRAGTASTKTRGEVRGSNAKPWKQKGTGRARVGTKRNPIWRGGGIAFGPRPRDYSYKMPKKAMRGALLSAIRFKVSEGTFKIIDTVSLAESKTRQAVEMFKNAKLSNALLITENDDKNLLLATRNLKNFKVLKADAINVYDILNYKELVMTKAAFDKVEAATS